MFEAFGSLLVQRDQRTYWGPKMDFFKAADGPSMSTGGILSIPASVSPGVA